MECFRWGEFEIQIRINFVPEAAEKQYVLYHHLKLHPWAALGSTDPEIPPPEVAAKLGPVHSWQYDEVAFNEPYQSFMNILKAHPPTPLPKTKRRPVPFSLAHPDSIADAKAGGTPEFTQAMVQEEAERLEKARKQVIAEQDKWRAVLIEKENLLQALKRQLEA